MLKYDNCLLLESIYDCQIRLPQHERLSGLCSRHRHESIVRERKHWKLTAPGDPDDPNPYDKLLPPILNQSLGSISRKILFDGEEMLWYHFSYMGKKTLKKAKEKLQKLGFLNHTLTSYNGYKGEYQYLKRSLKVSHRYRGNLIIYCTRGSFKYLRNSYATLDEFIFLKVRLLLIVVLYKSNFSTIAFQNSFQNFQNN